jgi:hypothetical protein
MCEGVRNNDQAALEQLFDLVKGMSWPLCLNHRDAGDEGAENE